MDYLPNEPNDQEPKNIEKTEKKQKEFREYLVEKGVVLAFVKGKIKIKSSELYFNFLSTLKFKIFRK